MENVMKTLLRCFSLLIPIVYSLLDPFISRSIQRCEISIGGTDCDLKQNEEKKFACKFQEKLALDSKESVLQTLQELASQQARDPKTNSCFRLFHPEAQFFNMHWSFTRSPKQERYGSMTLDFRLLGTFRGLTAAEVVSPLWVVCCDPVGEDRKAILLNPR